jgi:DNA-binding MarR family transcriptional regulator
VRIARSRSASWRSASGWTHRRASRLVAAAIRARYVARFASQADGRRIGLELTLAGHELARAGHQFRRAVFARATHDWSEREREQFADLLTRFTDTLTREVVGPD